MTCNKFVKSMKGDEGSSFIELVFFLVIISVVGLAMTFQMSQQFRETGSLEKEQAFVELVGQLQQLSSSHAFCTNTLGGAAPPVDGAPLNIATGGLTLASGTNYQSGLLKITQLKWERVLTLSPTESVGYFSVTVDLSAGSGQTLVGGNTRTFPAAGSNPPGIMVDMQVNSGTGNVVSCGAPDPLGSTEYFTFPITVSTSDSTDYSGLAVLPTAYPDANYIVICSVTNPQADAHGTNYGQLTQTSLAPNSFVWHYWQERGNYIPGGTVLTANCITHHN